MTEEKTIAASDSAPTESAAEALEPARGSGPYARAGPTLALVALGMSIGLTVAAYFTWDRLQQLNTEQMRLYGRIDDELQPLSASMQNLRQELRGRRQQTDRDMAKLGQELKSLSHRLSVLASLAGRGESGWVLSEVEYLLRIANQRLVLQRDVETARVALRSADARLRELGDPRYVNVRRQIAAELDTLEAVPDVDTAGIVVGLGALQVLVDKLPVAGAGYAPRRPAEMSGPEQPRAAADWTELPGVIWSALSEVFRVREHDRPVEPMLPPAAEYFLRENLRLQLAAARLALLRNEGAQYREALGTASEWLAVHFAQNSPQVEQAVSRLEELAALDVAPELPDISASLRLLREQMKPGGEQAADP
ncbi:MAG: uroporphyrinogen-III C-methyltransferase [Gammaproteobacteria bacterium]|jgi:uroporphyrin-3 C-methyltransferase